MASTIKVNNIQNQCGANIVNKCSTTITLGASGDTIQLACGASQTGFGRTGTVNWDTTAKTAGFTAVSGNGYFVNTTSGAITATLPAGSPGAIVAFADYANTWDTNNLIITPNGSDKIAGTNANATVSTEGASTTFVYVDSTQGWKQVNDATLNTVGLSFIVATGGTVSCCGDYKIHTFTGPGTFTVCSVGSNPVNNFVDYLVVAGGGAGGSSGQCFTAGGGGGAGGYRESSGTATGCYTASPLGACVSALPVTATGYPITVGAGGTTTAGYKAVPPSAKGSNSVFSTITSTGGGGGKMYSSALPANANGGSGGGGGAHQISPGDNSIFGQSGNTPPVSPPQGNNGGNGDPAINSSTSGGGGGGATAVGSNNNPPVGGGPGGAGATTSISGSPTAYAGGGGGGNGTAPGGVGGGGAGANGGPGSIGTAGTANTGGGGGGSMTITTGPGGTGGSGGSGIVIIRYKYQ